jgi:predicted ester cyclase
MGMPPSGKSIDVKVIDIMQFDDAGMMCAHWGLFDTFSMMQRLGAIPKSPPA